MLPTATTAAPTFALFAPSALAAGGWADEVRIEIDSDGIIVSVCAGASPEGAERCRGPVLPGMPNLHSHAFQRAMAGRAERGSGKGDSFWTWREEMYRLALTLDPEQLGAVARMLYVEMLEGGFTSVAEFHYLHHDTDGSPYDAPAMMSLAVVEAAAWAGIGLTLLPVLYASSDLGGEPPLPEQRRFAWDPEGVLGLVNELGARHSATVRVGMALHSLRAVPEGMLREALDGLAAAAPGAPLHIHAAEQPAEVEACLRHLGKRPVEWLLANAPVGPEWCVVHATHMTPEESAGLAASGATVGLCPSTEANLGDGVFDLPGYLAPGGRFGVGTDSHVGARAAEELRLLEHGQRLVRRARCVAAPGGGSTGGALWRAALDGGARALGAARRGLEPGAKADLLVLDAEHPRLLGASGDDLLDALVFAGDDRCVADVMAGGRWAVRDGRHLRRAAAERDFARVTKELKAR